MHSDSEEEESSEEEDSDSDAEQSDGDEEQTDGEKEQHVDVVVVEDDNDEDVQMIEPAVDEQMVAPANEDVQMVVPVIPQLSDRSLPIEVETYIRVGIRHS